MIDGVPASPDPLKNAEEALEQWAQNAFSDEPFTKLITVVGLGAFLFYKAEHGVNPKVNSIWDAMIYTSTCASVGYGDIFAQTPLGKAIGSFIMTVGPAMANAALAGGQLAREAQHQTAEATQQQILSTMQQILAELKKQNEAPRQG
jgi:H+/gluconate symporter-like permease